MTEPNRKPDIAGRTQTEQITLETFAKRLQQILLEKNMSQSDLARAMWGSRTDARGMLVAKNRDRISSYLKGRSFPEMRNLKKMADVLNVKIEDLAPDMTAATIEKEDPEVAITAMAGHLDKVYLRVRKLVPLAVAAKIATILSEVDARD